MVKKAMTIPWNAVEKRYAALFTSRKGNVAKSLRLGLGACIIQAEYGYSDVETTLQIQEHPYLQYFCGYKAYDDSKPPFDPSMMVYFRKRLTPEILGEINEMILTAQEADSVGTDNDDDDDNRGTMIVDATCAPSQMAASPVNSFFGCLNVILSNIFQYFLLVQECEAPPCFLSYFLPHPFSLSAMP